MCQFWLVKGTAVSYFLSYLHIFAQCQPFFVEFTFYFFIQTCLYLHYAIFTFLSQHAKNPKESYFMSYHYTLQAFFVKFTKKTTFSFIYILPFSLMQRIPKVLQIKNSKSVSGMPRLMSLGLMAFQELLSMWIKLSSCVSKIAFSIRLGILKITRLNPNF